VEKGRSRSRDDLAPGTSRWLQVFREGEDEQILAFGFD